MITIVEHNLVRNLPIQLTTTAIRKYLKQASYLDAAKSCAEATIQHLASLPLAESPRPAIGTSPLSLVLLTVIMNAMDAGSDRLVRLVSQLS